MRFIDLTQKLKNNTSVYPGDPKFKLKNINDKNKDYSLFEIKGNLHTGTHIDAPYHYIANGKKVNNILLDNLIGKSNVFDVNHTPPNKEINLEDILSLKKIVQKKYSIEENPKRELKKIIILKTGWYNNWNCENYFTENPFLSKEVSKIIIENNISGVAIDSPSVDSYGENKIHKMLLKNNIWIVEKFNKYE